MKKIIFILFLPFISFSQQTYVPDDNFEQSLINQGYDTVLDDYVLTSNINQLTELYIGNSNIANLTGIADFVSLHLLHCSVNQFDTLDLSNNQNLDTLYCNTNNQLTSVSLPNSLVFLECEYNQSLTTLDLSNCSNLLYLYCNYNNLTTLDVSSNYSLEKLGCDFNQLSNLNLNNNTALINFGCMENLLTTLDLSNNNNLKFASIIKNNQLRSINLNGADSLLTLYAYENALTALDVSGNTKLKRLTISSNQITSLDVNFNTNLEYLNCSDNKLTSLDLRNGNNNFILRVANNPNLNCISVDDTAWANANWTVANGNIDPQHYFSLDCSINAIEEPFTTTDKTLIKTVNILGREATVKQKGLLFYIFSDGTVEKRIVIE